MFVKYTQFVEYKFEAENDDIANKYCDKVENCDELPPGCKKPTSFGADDTEIEELVDVDENRTVEP